MYARIENGQCVEYPVSEIHIINRRHRLEDYVKVQPVPKPIPKPWESVSERYPVLVNGVWTQRWEVIVNLREKAKAARADAVKKIKVTTEAGHTFDGDEASQDRMSRAIFAMTHNNIPSISWILADNTIADISVEELKEALAKAYEAQAAIWINNQQNTNDEQNTNLM